MHVPFPSVFLLSLAVVTLLLALPLRYGSVKPNPWYGIRFPQSFQSPEHWRLINRHGATMLIRWSFTMVALAVFFFVSPTGGDSPIPTMVALVYPLSVFVPVLISYRYARGLEKAVSKANAPPDV